MGLPSALFLILALCAGQAAAQTCTTTRTVCAAACDHTFIQAAVNAFAPALTGHSCVRIDDAGTYAEQVTIQNIANAGFALRIMAGPGVRPALNPPAASTAAFQVKNASVNILGLDIVPTSALPYGILASSAHVTVSSVNVDSGGRIYTAGIRISSWSAVSYSSVTVSNAHGFWLDGATMTTVGFSTAVNNSAGSHAVYLAGGKNNDFTELFASNSHVSGSGLYAMEADSNTVTRSYMRGGQRGVSLSTNADYNAISLSTMIGDAYSGLYVSDSDSNTVTQSYMWGGGYGVILYPEADYNAISLSTMSGNSSSGLYITWADSNIVTQSYLWGGFDGAFLDIGANYNAISLSTMNGNSSAGLFALAADSNTVMQSYMWGASYGIYLNTDSDYNAISLSTMIGNSNYGLHAAAANSITMDNCYVQGSTAVYIMGSTNVVIGGSRLAATSASGSGVWMTNGSRDLTLSSNTISGGASGAGVLVGGGNGGQYIFSTNTISGSPHGISIDGLPGASRVWITSNTILPALSAAGDSRAIFLNALAAGATIQNNGIYYRSAGSMGINTAYGIYAFTTLGVVIDRNRINQPGMVTDGSFVGIHLRDADRTAVSFNDLHAVGAGLVESHFLRLANGSIDVSVHNNVFLGSVTVTASSSTMSLEPASQAGFVSDYNSFFSSNSANTADWGGVSCALPNWTGAGCPARDANSIAAHPRWANTAAGAEDFHPLSAAGRYNPATGFFVSDSTTAATLDRADPAKGFALEPAPHNGRANLGSYGGTSEASKSLAPLVTAAQIAGVFASSVTVNWLPQALAAGGYLLETALTDNFASVYASSFTPSLAFSTLAISGIAVDATFYFRVASLNVDGVPNRVFVGSVSIDSPPGAVIDLSTLPVTAADDVARISWTAPGGNGFVGTAASYEIRYSTALITAGNFAQATLWVAARAVGGPVGTVETETITGLEPGATHYFALKTRDSKPNVSGLSNAPFYLTGSNIFPDVAAYSPASGRPGVAQSTSVTVQFTKSMSTDSFNTGFWVRGVVDKDGGIVSINIPWTVAFTTQTRTAVFTLTPALGRNVTHEVVFSTGCRDLQGRPLTSSVTWRFSTIFDHAVANTIIMSPGFQLSIPADAFGADGYMTVSTSAQSSAIMAANQKLLARDRFKIPASIMEITALTAADVPVQPSQPLLAVIPFADSNQDGFVDGLNPVVKAGTLSLWTLDENIQAWSRIPGATVDLQDRVVRSPLPHFSFFALIGGQDTSLADAHAFPVPYVPAKQAARVITFTGLSSRALIRIFTIDGVLVREIDESDGDGSVRWDARDRSGRGAASGVYLYVITNDSEKATGKLVIIR